MKVLNITGDDYAALYFEQHMGVEKAKEILAAGGEISEEGDEYQFSGKVYEFGPVDPKFIEFVRDSVQDYDDTKHTNFYVID